MVSDRQFSSPRIKFHVFFLQVVTMMHSLAPRKNVRALERMRSSGSSSDEDPFGSPRKNKRVIQPNYWKAPDTTYHVDKRRLKFNVSGTIFETYENTLDQFPETTLGCPLSRQEFYDESNNVYVLPCGGRAEHMSLT